MLASRVLLLRPPHSFSLSLSAPRLRRRRLPPSSSSSPRLGSCLEDGNLRRYASTSTPTHGETTTTLANGGEGETTKPYYVTTPIFYPNAKPHIGHLYTLVLGDVFARFRRLVEPGREVKFLVGTDEHGLKIQQAAQKAGMGEREFVDGLSGVFKSLSTHANISHTTFARTSSPSHRRAVDHVWRVLQENGYIYKGEYEGWYSVTDECFYTGTQVEPAPGRGDQRTYVSKETGSKVEWTKEHNYMFRLSAFREALVRHYTPSPSPSLSPGSSTTTTTTASKDPAIAKETPVFPAQYNSVVLQMLSASSASPPPSSSPSSPITPTQSQDPQALLADISISRPRTRLTWGIPVPTDPAHTVYVWFDALLIYLSGVGYPWPASSSSSSNPSGSIADNAVVGDRGAKTAETLEREAGWPADLQIIGKDILRFHAIYLPAILLALSGPSYSRLASPSPSSSLPPSSPPSLPPAPQPSLLDPPKPPGLPKRLLAHAHWTVSAAKMSKSVGNVVCPLAAMERWGVDVVRWYMCRVGGRMRDDVDWSEDQLEKHSRELQSLLGNYLLRVTSPKIVRAAELGRQAVLSSSSSLSPLSHTNEGEGGYKFEHGLNEELANLAVGLPRRVGENMERLEVGEAVERVVEVLKVANKTISDIAPWSKTCPPAVVFETRQVALLTLKIAAVCLRPFTPETSGKLLEALGVERAGWEDVERLEGMLGEEMRRVWGVEGVKLF